MTDTREIAARLQELESRLAFQDDTIDQLGAVIRQQWEQLDRLAQKAGELDQRLREVELREGEPSVAPPPHY